MHEVLPSWRWVVMYVVLVGVILATRLGLFYPRKKNGVWANQFSKVWGEYYLDIWLVVLGLGVGMYVISRTHALLPKRHDTICDITEEPTGGEHFLAYVTQAEKNWLGNKDRGGNGGRGSASKGLYGTQGVPCYPAPVGKMMKPARRKPDGTGFFPIEWTPLWRENVDDIPHVRAAADGMRVYYKDHNGVKQYKIPNTPIEPSPYPGMYRMSFDDTHLGHPIIQDVKLGSYAQLDVAKGPHRMGRGRLNFS